MTGPAVPEFALQPTLKGELVEARPLAPADFDALFAAASDPLIWEQHPDRDRYRREVFLEYFAGAIASNGAFAVIDRASGRVIGCTRYCNFDAVKSEIEIGWTFLARPYWGGAYNGELKSLMLAHAFRFVDRVQFVIGEDNLRSQKAVEKIGARLSGRTEMPSQDGTMTPHLVFVVERP